MAAGKGRNEAGVIVAITHRQGGQLQAGDPAFGADFERLDNLGRELQAHRIVEKPGSFIGCKAQIGCAQFVELPAHTQARQAEGRLGA